MVLGSFVHLYIILPSILIVLQSYTWHTYISTCFIYWIVPYQRCAKFSFHYIWFIADPSFHHINLVSYWLPPYQLRTAPTISSHQLPNPPASFHRISSASWRPLIWSTLSSFPFTRIIFVLCYLSRVTVWCWRGRSCEWRMSGSLALPLKTCEGSTRLQENEDDEEKKKSEWSVIVRKSGREQN